MSRFFKSHLQGLRHLVGIIERRLLDAVNDVSRLLSRPADSLGEIGDRLVLAVDNAPKIHPFQCDTPFPPAFVSAGR